MKVSFRQGIVSAQLTAPNTLGFLQITNNGYVDHVASPDPTLINFAYKSKGNYLVEVRDTKLNAWGPFNDATKTSYLYWDIDLKNGALTYGSTFYNPVYLATAPLNPAIDQHWFDTTNMVMMVWKGTFWVERIRVFAGIINSASSISYIPLGTQVAVATDCEAGYILYDDNNYPVRTSDGYFFTSGTTASAKFSIAASTVKFDQNIMTMSASEPIGAYSLVAIAGANVIALADPIDDSRQAIGIVERGVNTGEVVNVIFRGAVTNQNWKNVTVENIKQFTTEHFGKYLYTGPTGKFTLTRPTTQNALKIGTILNETTIYIDIDTVSEFAAASGVQAVIGEFPIVVTGAASTPRVGIVDATTSTSGAMSSADKIALDTVITELSQEKIDRINGDAAIATKVSRSGDTMTGDLTLLRDPTSNLHAATKQYVDSAIDLPNILFVDKNAVNSSADGSLANPFVSITSAIAASTIGKEIFILPGTYSEGDIVLNKDLSITGVPGLTLIDSKLRILSGVANISNLTVENSVNASVADVSVEINGATQVTFDNVILSKAVGSSAPTILITGSGTDPVRISNSVINGVVSAGQNIPRVVIFDDIQSPSKNFALSIAAQNIVTVRNADILASVTHNGGALTLQNVGKIGAFTTTASGLGNLITVKNSSFRDASGTLVGVTMAAAASFIFAGVEYDDSASTLGTRVELGEHATDISATRTPTNYVANDGSVTGHLKGIDSALVNKENVGVAATILASHLGDSNPHTQYALKADLNALVHKAGDTMQGSLTLHADPVDILEAATKQYVDNKVIGATPALTVGAGLAKQTDWSIYAVSADTNAIEIGVGIGLPLKSSIVHDLNGSDEFAYTKVYANKYGVIVHGENPSTLAGYNITDGATISYVDAYANRTITISGDVSGSGITSIPVSLPLTGVEPGAYTRVSVNGKGLVTAGDNPTTLAGYDITDAYTKIEVDTTVASLLQIAGGTMTGMLTLFADPVQDLDAATKAYVDAHSSSGSYEYLKQLKDVWIKADPENGSFLTYGSYGWEPGNIYTSTVRTDDIPEIVLNDNFKAEDGQAYSNLNSLLIALGYQLSLIRTDIAARLAITSFTDTMLPVTAHSSNFVVTPQSGQTVKLQDYLNGVDDQIGTIATNLAAKVSNSNLTDANVAITITPVNYTAANAKLADHLSGIDVELGVLKTDIASVTTSVASKVETTTFTPVSSQVATNTSDISALTTSVGTLQTQVASSATSITTLSTAFDTTGLKFVGAAPSSNKAAGNKGDTYCDGTYLFVCIETSTGSSLTPTWVRVAVDSTAW